ncbi:MAG: ATP synthase F1 subunit delta [Desulfobacterales bacterium]|nr:MAG: ATP synthase F1 subunit delta [Desulfobacterales bacterium]
MKNLTIARRYAKALLLIGKEDDQVEAYREELQRFANLLDQETELYQAVTNPLYDAAGRRLLLQALIEKLGLSKVMASYLMLLFDKGRMGYIGDITNFYRKLADELKGIARASLVSAAALPSETIEKIRTGLSQKTGKNVILEVEQDPSLIGGIVTKIGDLVLDGSIKTQLANIRESLRRGEGI